MRSQTTVINQVMGSQRDSRSGTSDTEVVIIGAGPYGLSAAAHLRSAGVDVRVFGRPMQFWAEKMPAGMLLRSPRVASNLSAPSPSGMLEAYEATAEISPKSPLPLETFVNYGQWFQRQFIPNLEHREVVAVDVVEGGFRSVLEDETAIYSKRVVVAAGIGPFKRIPQEFRSLPDSVVTHCYSGFDVRGFSGRSVIVIGAGQSALESAALLHEAGAEVRDHRQELHAPLDWTASLAPSPRPHIFDALLQSRRRARGHKPARRLAKSRPSHSSPMERQNSHACSSSCGLKLVASSP